MPEEVPFNVTTHFKKTYEDNLRHTTQQKGAKLLDRVETTGKGGEELFFDLFGPRDPQEIVDRYGDTPNKEQKHHRRRLIHTDWEDGKLIEKVDTLRTLTDPRNKLIQSMGMGFGRTIDKTIYDQSLGTAYSGKTGSTANSLPAGQTVAVDYVESGSAANSGLTIGKLRRVVAIFEDNDVEVNPQDVTFVGTSTQKQNLLATTEVTSSDYAAVKALVNGEVNEFLGMTFRWVNGRINGKKIVKTSATNIRDCVAFHREGVLLDMPLPMVNELAKHPGKRFNWQLYMAMVLGAVRLEEEKVVKVLCHEAP